MNIKYSCVIPALNEQNNIESLLISIKKQKLPLNTVISDLIVVDNGSQDSTVDISRRYTEQVYTCPDLTIGGLRNFGAKKARGNMLLFLDADNVLSENVILRLTETIKRYKPGAIGIPLRPYGKPTWIEKTWFYHIHNYKNDIVNATTLASGAFCIGKELFDHIGGFNESLKVGEDTDLANRIKSADANIILDTKCVVLNKGFPKNVYQFFKVEYWHGDSIKSLFTHRTLSFLTLYFIICLSSVLISILSVFHLFHKSLIGLPILIVLVPSIYKAYKRRKKIDFMFFRLIGMYFMYIISRTASLLRI